MAVEQQLSLEVGGEIGQGIVSSFGITGRVTVKGQLERDASVHLVVTDADGEVVFSRYGKVTGVAILSKEQDGVQWTERAHTIKVVDVL